MGVTYKLSAEVVDFIVRQRQENPKFSCRQLAENVLSQFNVHVSKSSVHEVLKEAHIITPRGRKSKQSFQIPLEKKAQILSLLPADFVKPADPMLPEPAVHLRPDPILGLAVALNESKQPAPELVREEVELKIKDVFLEAAFLDLSAQKVLNVARFDQMPQEPGLFLDYAASVAAGYKITFSDGLTCFIDGRWQHVSGRLDEPQAVPIERAVKEAADFLINNSEVLFVRGVEEPLLNDFAAGLSRQGDRCLSEISVVDEESLEIVKFDDIVDFKRYFIAEITNKVDNLSNFLTLVDVEGKFLITNLIPDICEKEVVLLYQRWVCVDAQRSVVGHLSGAGEKTAQAFLEQRTKELFFDHNVVLEDFGQVKARVETSPNERRLYLELPEHHPHAAIIKAAAQRLNGLNIAFSPSQKIRVFIQDYIKYSRSSG